MADEIHFCEEKRLENEPNRRIFEIKDYSFLKKKRLESKEKTKSKHPWTAEEDKRLTNLKTNYPHLTWNEISGNLTARNEVQCLHRWTKVLQPGLKKGKWSEEEDRILIEWVKRNGPRNWCKIKMTGRTSKQIRDRWVNNLNPARINFKWTEEKDRLLLSNYLELGSAWVQIAKIIRCSTENMVKNRFYSLLRSCAARHAKEKGIKRVQNKEKYVSKVNLKKSEAEKFLDWEEEDDMPQEDESKISFGVKKYKRKNMSLMHLINYLPFLLEEKGIDANGTLATESLVHNDDEYVKEESQSIVNSTAQSTTCTIDETQKQILTNFFTTLSDRLSKKENPPQNIEQESRTPQFKLKSTILFTLQLTLLNRIFEKIKLRLFKNSLTVLSGKNSKQT